jgi:hypothetical protein
MPELGEERRDPAGNEDLARRGDFGDPSADVDGDAIDVVTHEFDLTRMETAGDAHAQAVCSVANGTSASDATSRAIECREEVVASRVDLPTTEAAELVSDCGLVALEKVAPCSVSQRGGRARRVDHVNEQVRGQNPVDVQQRAHAGEEFGHHVDQRRVRSTDRGRRS